MTDKFRLPTEIPHCRILWIGLLQGTWKEMGLQYGERCAEDIAYNFDTTWEKTILKGDALWQKGRTAEERATYCIAYLERSLKELSFLAPELIELYEGMAEGATRELDKCRNHHSCSHFLKIFNLNWENPAFHPDWDFSHDRPHPRPAVPVHGDEDDHSCNGFWVKGKATRTGETFATRHAQGRHLTMDGTSSGRERQVAYVAIPKDPSARVFWGSGRAGNLGGGPGGGLLNDHGVCVLTSGCSHTKEHWEEADETCAPGIKDFILGAYGVIFSKSAREAAERMTIGTETYRNRTRRKTILGARGANVVFGDPNEAYCVEHVARHFAVRKPGDLHERDANFMVNANHFKVDRGSYGENGLFQSDQAMTRYEPENERGKDSSYYRFWSGMWMLHHAYGRIDREMITRELTSSHFAYDREGTRFDPDRETGIPSVVDQKGWTGTFCAHIGPFTRESPLGLGGSTETTVFNLSSLEVWWVPVWPCHFKEWNLSWYYFDLKPFAHYRKLLWGS